MGGGGLFALRGEEGWQKVEASNPYIIVNEANKILQNFFYTLPPSLSEANAQKLPL